MKITQSTKSKYQRFSILLVPDPPRLLIFPNLWPKMVKFWYKFELYWEVMIFYPYFVVRITCHVQTFSLDLVSPPISVNSRDHLILPRLLRPPFSKKQTAMNNCTETSCLSLSPFLKENEPLPKTSHKRYLTMWFFMEVWLNWYNDVLYQHPLLMHKTFWYQKQIAIGIFVVLSIC